MNNDWFDAEMGLLSLDEQVMQSESFRTIMADGVVTDAELSGQSERVLDLLRQTQACLNPEQRERVGRLLVEMSVLHAVAQYHELADLRLK